MTKLKTFANLWTLWDHPAPGAGEWSLEAKVAAVAEAGFDAVMGAPGCGIGRLAESSRLAFAAFSRLDGRHDFSQVMEACQAEGAIVLQVHLGWHDTPADEALELALRLDAAAHDLGLETVIETHRDTCTETPEKTVLLASRFQAATGGRPLPLLLDFSHPAIVKHLNPPYAPRLLADGELVRLTRWHHLRPFNGHHAQIPVLTPDGSLSPEMKDWLELARAIFKLLKGCPWPEVWACPEIGPVRGGYGLACFPPSWNQATVLRELLVQEWNAIQISSCP